MSVAILSTGDELVNGDVQNTTSCEMAHHLFSYNVRMGSQMVVNDEHATMLQAMHFLLDNHDVLIVTGGLGPTSDDRTRYAMGAYFEEPLVFHEACWTHITTRHQALGIETSENNRQQALFPGAVTLIPNHGSAYGCAYSKNGKTMYLLPGPPNECLPMFHEYVLPQLKQRRDKHTLLYRWLLFGISESAIAIEVEEILETIPCEISYRWFYPYIEVKIKVSDRQLTKSFFDEKLKAIFTPLIISPFDKTALAFLRERLKQLDNTLLIDDAATHGALESELMTPGLSTVLFQRKGILPEREVQIKGLARYWASDKREGEDNVQIIFKHEEKEEEINVSISLQKSDPIKYALEIIAYHLNECL